MPKNGAAGFGVVPSNPDPNSVATASSRGVRPPDIPEYTDGVAEDTAKGSQSLDDTSVSILCTRTDGVGGISEFFLADFLFESSRGDMSTLTARRARLDLEGDLDVRYF